MTHTLRVALVAALISHAASASSPSFLAARSYPLPVQPFSIGIADFNRDGSPDIAFAGTGVAVSLNSGADGQFGKATILSASDESQELAIADMNGDSRLDIVSVKNGSVATYLSRGDGTFQAPVLSAGVIYVQRIALADFDGDGKNDVATLNPSEDKLFVLFGNGDGSTRQPVSYATSSVPLGLAAGDFNRDGRTDLAVLGVGSHVIEVFQNTGNGSMNRTATLPAPAGATFAAADFDGDGLTDLVAGAENGAAKILINRGDGSFEERALPIPGTFKAVYAADVDQNPVADLIVSVEINSATLQVVLANNGHATFQETCRFPATGIPATADVDRDGKLDLLVADYFAPAFTVARGLGSGRFVTTTVVQSDYRPVSANQSSGHTLAVADIDNDGTLDLITTNNNDSVSVLRGQGAGTFQQLGSFPVSGPSLVRVGDVNHDGRPDLVVDQSPAKTFAVFLNSGNGTFGTGISNSLDNVSRRQDFITVDVNGDGFEDVVATDSTTAYVAISNGDGTFKKPVPLDVGPFLGMIPFSPAAGDFDRDGKTDLVVTFLNVGTGNVLGFFRCNGDGTFRTLIPTRASTDAIRITVGDFDRDGRLDLLTTFSDLLQPSADKVTVWFGKGDGTFSPRIYSATGSPTTPLIGDINGDGFPDAIVSKFGSSDVAVYLANSDGTLRDPISFSTVSSPRTMGIGDLNRDGKPDLAVASGPDNAIAILTNITQTEIPRRRAVRKP